MKGRILVVDDAAILRQMIKNILTTQGHEVVGEAINGKEALEKYKKLKPDIVTMDIVMPEVDGIQALKNILAFDKKAKVIIISVIDQRKSLIEAIKAGAADFIIKPFEFDRVIAAVEECLNKV
jgi:two-component system chemotaxis response regulator CheY